MIQTSVIRIIIASWLIALSTQPVSPDYALGPEDILDIKVYARDVRAMDVSVRISSRGMITLPLLGEVKAGGLTLKELENEITQSLNRDYFVNPQVLLDVKQFRPRKIFVLGQINNPGEYDITGPKTVTMVQAISLAGGLTKGAAANSARITRIENDLEKVIEVKLEDIIEDGKKKQDVILRDGDIIFVPRRFF